MGSALDAEVEGTILIRMLKGMKNQVCLECQAVESNEISFCITYYWNVVCVR